MSWKFEDIIAWQRARTLVSEIYAVSRTPEFCKDFRFKDQIRAAAVSAMCNIAEGAESGSTKEFVRFLNIAKASAAEVRSDLYVALDQAYISESQFGSLCDHALEVTRLIGGLRSSLLRKAE